MNWIDDAGLDRFEHGVRVLIGGNVNGAERAVIILQLVVVDRIVLVAFLHEFFVVGGMLRQTVFDTMCRRRMFVRVKSISGDGIQTSLGEALQRDVERNVQEEHAAMKERMSKERFPFVCRSNVPGRNHDGHASETLCLLSRARKADHHPSFGGAVLLSQSVADQLSEQAIRN